MPKIEEYLWMTHLGGETHCYPKEQPVALCGETKEKSMVIRIQDNIPDKCCQKCKELLRENTCPDS